MHTMLHLQSPLFWKFNFWLIYLFASDHDPDHNMWMFVMFNIEKLMVIFCRMWVRSLPVICTYDIVVRPVISILFIEDDSEINLW